MISPSSSVSSMPIDAKWILFNHGHVAPSESVLKARSPFQVWFKGKAQGRTTVSGSPDFGKGETSGSL